MSRVYLVEDHQIMRDGLRALLEARGHAVVGESDDPTQALADLLRLKPEVLLLDLNLGGAPGWSCRPNCNDGICRCAPWC